MKNGSNGTDNNTELLKKPETRNRELEERLTQIKKQMAKAQKNASEATELADFFSQESQQKSEELTSKQETIESLESKIGRLQAENEQLLKDVKALQDKLHESVPAANAVPNSTASILNGLPPAASRRNKPKRGLLTPPDDMLSFTSQLFADDRGRRGQNDMSSFGTRRPAASDMSSFGARRPAASDMSSFGPPHKRARVSRGEIRSNVTRASTRSTSTVNMLKVPHERARQKQSLIEIYGEARIRVIERLVGVLTLPEATTQRNQIEELIGRLLTNETNNTTEIIQEWKTEFASELGEYSESLEKTTRSSDSILRLNDQKLAMVRGIIRREPAGFIPKSAVSEDYRKKLGFADLSSSTMSLK